MSGLSQWRRCAAICVVTALAGACGAGDAAETGRGDSEADRSFSEPNQPSSSSLSPAASDDSDAVVISNWTVEDEPLLSLGAEADGPTSDLFRAYPVLLSDGGIAIADGGMRLMLFAMDGSHLRTVGRQGRGPGEFERITWLQRLPGDTLVVGDQLPGGRVSLFTRDGEFVRMAPMPQRWSATYGVFADGTIFGGRVHILPAIGVGEIYRRSVDLLRFDQTGAVADTFGTVPDYTFVGAGIGLVQVTQLPFTSVAVSGQRAYVTTGEQLEVQVYEADEGYVGTFSAPYSPHPLSRSEIAREFEDTQFAKAVTVATLHNLPENPVRGVSDAIIVDDLGNVWVRELWRDRETPSRWWVFDANGHHTATSTVPPRFILRHIATDRVIGIHRDEFDVERVQVRRLVKPTI